jgi:hypothetical protein
MPPPTGTSYLVTKTIARVAKGARSAFRRIKHVRGKYFSVVKPGALMDARNKQVAAHSNWVIIPAVEQRAKDGQGLAIQIWVKDMRGAMTDVCRNQFWSTLGQLLG